VIVDVCDKVGVSLDERVDDGDLNDLLHVFGCSSSTVCMTLTSDPSLIHPLTHQLAAFSLRDAMRIA